MKQLLIFTLLLCAGTWYVVANDGFFHFPQPEPCKEWKTVTSIENYPLSNFWGKEIRSIIHYDNGSSYETTTGDLYQIGEKTCAI